MYNHELKAGDCYYAEAQTVPQNDSADGNGGALELSGTNAGIEIVAVVTTALAIADTKVFSIVLHESSDNAVADDYAAIQTLYTVTADGATAVVAGTELGRFLLPTDTEKYTKVVLTSDDATMTGAVSVYARYVGR
jgi:hypothetical protein